MSGKAGDSEAKESALSAEQRMLMKERGKLEQQLKVKWEEQRRLSIAFNELLTGNVSQGGSNIGLIESERLLIRNLDAAIVQSRKPGYFKFYQHPEDCVQVESKGELKNLTRRIQDVERECDALKSELARVEKQRKELAKQKDVPINSMQQWFAMYGKPENQPVAGFATVYKKNPKVYGGTKYHRAFKSVATTMKTGRIWR